MNVLNLLKSIVNFNKPSFLNNQIFRPLLVLFPLFFMITFKGFSQPFIDVTSFSYQTFSSQYKDNAKSKNKTDDYFFNLFLPKQYKNGNVLLLGLNSEMMNSSIMSDLAYSSKLYMLTLPIGFRFVSTNKKWNTVVMSLQKLSSDFKDVIDKHDYQYGGVFLQTYIPNEKLKIKAGLYYNREYFGNFFIPLVGVDWRINDRINMYGVLPTNYRIEINAIKNKLYTGFGLRSFTRSFRLSKLEGYDYVRYNEIQLKLFVDYFVYKKILLFAELGYSLGKNPLQYKYNTKELETVNNPVYGPIKNYPVINIGLAYRIRMDLEKKE